ncbi:hypothetical protein PMI14_00374 [Acidovorax sp. CF316]|nr:hypothetical protein PMI14_00374 [Acidovorax sp. CF316]
MTTTTGREKALAALQTACICIAVELAIVLLLGALTGSYLGALGVSLVILGPASLWLAPSVYGRLLRTQPQVGAKA